LYRPKVLFQASRLLPEIAKPSVPSDG